MDTLRDRRVFQSPSLRGSGRFRSCRPRRRRRRVLRGFNPLHCGAVVASNLIAPRRMAEGQGVSIPFIAGQWSLHEPHYNGAVIDAGFNPLHCGAVVASRRRHTRRKKRCQRFNPLHCGAVVASGSGRRCARRTRRRFNPLHCGAVVASFLALFVVALFAETVSIPFIAGQWSLRGKPLAPLRGQCGFQSPSLRGSGRFDRIAPSTNLKV